jgi:hypothetical protein
MAAYEGNGLFEESFVFGYFINTVGVYLRSNIFGMGVASCTIFE